MQLIGIGATVGYIAVVTFLILKVVDVMLGLRVSSDEETEGLDINQHNERGYDL